MILSFAIFALAITAHEFAHGFCAYKLGDPTAKYAGRLTLNPLAHIDPFGTILLPLMLMLSGAPVIGWAKPVPINFWGLKNPKRDMALVGLAGPLANFLCAFLAASILKKFFLHNEYAIAPLISFIQINLALAVFNLIPIPPLDGSRLLLIFIPWGAMRLYNTLERYGFVILFILVWFRFIDKVIWPAVDFLIFFLLGR